MIYEVHYSAASIASPTISSTSAGTLKRCGSRCGPFVSANVALTGDFDDKLTPAFREVKLADRTVGVTAILGAKYQKEIGDDEIAFEDPAAALARIVPKMKKRCQTRVLLSHATPDESRALAKRFPAFQIVVTSGGADESRSRMSMPSMRAAISTYHRLRRRWPTLTTGPYRRSS